MTQSQPKQLAAGPLTVAVAVDGITLPEALVGRVRAISPRIELIERPTPDDYRRAQVVFTAGANVEPEAVPNLRWVQTQSASIAHIVNRPLLRCGVPVANVKGAYTPAVAELAIALLLAMTRRLPQCQEWQTRRVWPDDRSFEQLAGENCCVKTLGVLGYGSIGRQIARIADAMGMTILACKRNPQERRDDGFHAHHRGDPEGALPQAWFDLADAPAMLRRCDALAVSLPLTGQTRGLVNAAMLAHLPPHAYLVDVSRGGVIDGLAMAEALHAGRLASAALDVFEQEPLPADHPLWKAPRLIITPHIASFSRDQLPLSIEVLIENLRRYLEHRPLVNLVNVEQGY